MSKKGRFTEDGWGEGFDPAMIFGAVFLMAIAAVICIIFNDAKDKGPQFKVGDCVAFSRDVEFLANYETWQKPTLLSMVKILEVGKKSYRVAVAAGDYRSEYFYFTGETVSFMDQHRYIKVTCVPGLSRYN